MINLNSSENWLNDDWEGTDTIVPRHETMKIINVTQLEKDAILVCYDSKCSFFSCVCGNRILFKQTISQFN